MLLRRSVVRAYYFFSTYYIIMMRASPAGRPSMAAQLTRVNTTFSTTAGSGKRPGARGVCGDLGTVFTLVDPLRHRLSARARRTYGLARTRFPQVYASPRADPPPCPSAGRPAGLRAASAKQQRRRRFAR